MGTYSSDPIASVYPQLFLAGCFTDESAPQNGSLVPLLTLLSPFSSSCDTYGRRSNTTSHATSTAEAPSPKSSITAYPNPLANSNFNLQFADQPRGAYQIILYNSVGQVVLDRRIEHSGGSAVQNIRLDKTLPPGVYRLRVMGKDEQTTITLSSN